MSEVDAVPAKKPDRWIAWKDTENPDHAPFFIRHFQTPEAWLARGWRVTPFWKNPPVDTLRAEVLVALERIAGMLEPASEPGGAAFYAFDVGSETERLLLEVLRKAAKEGL